MNTVIDIICMMYSWYTILYESNKYYSSICNVIISK